MLSVEMGLRELASLKVSLFTDIFACFWTISVDIRFPLFLCIHWFNILESTSIIKCAWKNYCLRQIHACAICESLFSGVCEFEFFFKFLFNSILSLGYIFELFTFRFQGWRCCCACIGSAKKTKYGSAIHLWYWISITHKFLFVSVIITAKLYSLIYSYKMFSLPFFLFFHLSVRSSFYLKSSKWKMW